MLATGFQKAFLLHAYAYRETSLMLDLLTEQGGRLCAIAKGAKRPKSPARGLLVPFQPLNINISGRRELLTLTQTESAGHRFKLPPQARLSGYYLNELLLRVLEIQDPCPLIFKGYQCCLNHLETLQNINPILRLFERDLLKVSGFALQLEREIRTGQRIQSGTSYVYLHEQGPVRAECLESFQLSTTSFAEQINIKGSNLLALAYGDLTLSKSDLLELKSLTQMALKTIIGNRPLKTRQFYQKMIQLGDQHVEARR